MERQQRHHNCVVLNYQDELVAAKTQLLEVATKLSINQKANKAVDSDSSHVKELEYQLKMVSIYMLLIKCDC